MHLLRDSRISALLLLWLSQFFVAALSAGPTFVALEGMPDNALAEPGGLLLLEHLRLKRELLLSAAKESFALLAIGQLLLLMVRARLTESLVIPLLNQHAARSRWKSLGSYFGFSVLFTLLRAIVIVATLWTLYRMLPDWDGSLHHKQIIAPAAVLLLGAGGSLALNVIADSSKVVLFALLPCDSKVGRLTWLRQLWSKHFFSLSLARLLRALVQVGAFLLSFWLLVAPQGFASSFPITCAIAHQVVILFVLTVEAYWLHFIAVKLATKRPSPQA